MRYSKENRESGLKEGEKPVKPLEILKFDTDSYLTIKTKKSSKFSLTQINSSEKLDLKDIKGLKKLVGQSNKELRFNLNNEIKRETMNTIKKQVTPNIASKKGKGSFKFDLSLINNDSGSKKKRVIYPHSCKNANMKPILEIQELCQPTPVNLRISEEELSMESVLNKRKESGMHIKIDSNFKGSRKSDLSEIVSPKSNYLQGKLRNYEQKIKRLKTDQKFKIDNYKRILSEKELLIEELQNNLAFYKSKCSEYKESLTIQRELNQINQQKLDTYLKADKRAVNSTYNSKLNERFSSHSQTINSSKQNTGNKQEDNTSSKKASLKRGYGTFGNPSYQNDIDQDDKFKTDKFTNNIKDHYKQSINNRNHNKSENHKNLKKIQQAANKQLNDGKSTRNKEYNTKRKLDNQSSQKRNKVSHSFKSSIHSTTNKLTTTKYNEKNNKAHYKKMITLKDKFKLIDTPKFAQNPTRSFCGTSKEYFNKQKDTNIYNNKGKQKGQTQNIKSKFKHTVMTMKSKKQKKSDSKGKLNSQC